jgi:hypothetical protein
MESMVKKNGRRYGNRKRYKKDNGRGKERGEWQYYGQINGMVWEYERRDVMCYRRKEIMGTVL